MRATTIHGAFDIRVTDVPDPEVSIVIPALDEAITMEAFVAWCLHGLADAGVRAVVQPGGSIRDEEVIAAAEEAGVTMYFSGTRHFFH